ncbi:T9SS type A sorting domain-containing protein [Flavobacterium salilacus subsp. salilacus]|uniref:T9SS type A sorting domain-containing protein n=1 Tax=Flavobacterium TaxID=237 RepID=UPI00107571FA|nr:MULTISPECIES: T9SS type A sorting domain-containing protein [Flavobacterium]KAF2518132.1 T9SS type A sorting domain-containing protein [Flavobacterium salilacus subsp. salilacus]MBE1615558.1 T9SS type A sorting domain-containing protein [Flavobacterium sp. SaA2.13]
MKFKITLYFLLIGILAQAQVTNEGKPKSWKLRNIEQVEPINMPDFDLKALQEEDKANEGRKDMPWRFGHEFIVDYNLDNSGSWHTLPDGSRIWRIRFYSEGAKTMNFLFSDFYMPKGATLYLYSNDHKNLLGAYDSKQNNEERVLGTWLVEGEDIWLEYYEPADVAGQGKLEIFKLIHGYRTGESYAKSTQDLNDSGACNYDVDCVIPDIQALKDINKKAVAMIVVGGSGFCSGALVNNTNNDGTPYFLTANHCYSNPSQWAFRFNWISPNPVCASNANSANSTAFLQTASGATLRARREASDFCLVEITANLPDSWDLVWAGWDRSDIAPASTFGIHHPSGDIMKTCRDYNPPAQTIVEDKEMWRVNDWDLGVTEGGSSGSPLFDNNGRIIGQLFAGTAACAGTNDNGGEDIYGRFAISWDQGFSSIQRLKEWLDPGNTNAVTLDYYPQAVTTDAEVTIVSLGDDACNAVISPVIKITNEGTNQLNTVEVTYQLNDNEPVVYNWIGSLTTGQSEDITLPVMTPVNGGNTFTVTLSQPNGVADQNTGNDVATETFSVNAYPEDVVEFALLTDEYGEETSWELTNQNGSVLYSGSGYDDSQSYTELFNLDGGCYTFTITDTIGDGICCTEGNGSYSLTVGGITIIQGGDFGASESVTFILDSNLTVTQQAFKNAFKVYPNPSSGIFNVIVDDTLAVNYQLYNMLGQVVAGGKFAAGESKLDISSAADGIYMLQVTDVNGKTANFKLVKE